ncbi:MULTISPECIES: hypothetical protein [unclassified Erythrobacter]|uniref:hypothetical protein n=1 Tax=unclassified Erythrobacter TaxID=2633097 RepID=UPI000B1D7AAE|nr:MULTISPECIES: hypothetical protein [unclassified Erythrobacter]
MNLEEMFERGEITVGRKYTAIDPAVKVFECTCGKPDCPIAALRPFRDHIKALRGVIITCGQAGIIPYVESVQDPWSAITYPLVMAASIDDVFVDPYFVDDSDAGLWCDAAWEAEEADREDASKYVAALTIFNFVWLAYEAAVAQVAGDRFAKDKVPVRARKILQDAESPAPLRKACRMFYLGGRRLCTGTGRLEERIEEIESRFGLRDEAAAAELGRLFRNHVVHGDDPIPAHGLLSSSAIPRFYAIARMLLVLIQQLVRMHLLDPRAQINLSPMLDEESEPADWALAHLHLKEDHWVRRADDGCERPED